MNCLNLLKRVLAYPMRHSKWINDPSVSDATRRVRQNCSERGHKLISIGGQGDDGLVRGCYCGFVKLAVPLWPDEMV